MQENILIRKALESDVADMVKLMSDNFLGQQREQIEGEIAQSYYDAFHTIDRDINQMLVAVTSDNKLIGTLQISFITNMSFMGAKRALIEGVHVDKDLRGKGIGKIMMEWAINEARKSGCRFVQLTSNKQRLDAHRFYKKLGFTPSHEGFKLDLVGS